MNQRKAASGGIASLFILALFAGITIVPGVAGAVPTFVGATTVDGFGALLPNGHIDAMEIEMSAAIDDSTVRLGDFSVSGYSIIGFSTNVEETAVAAVADDKYFTLLLAEGVSPDTDATPATSYTKGTLAELAAPMDLAASKTGITVTDAADPFMFAPTFVDITPAVATVESEIYLEYSEPVTVAAGDFPAAVCNVAGDVIDTEVVAVTPAGASESIKVTRNVDTTAGQSIGGGTIPGACTAIVGATDIGTVYLDEGSAVARFIFDTPLESMSSQALTGSQVQVVKAGGGVVSGFTLFTHVAGSDQATALLNAKANAADVAGTTFALLANVARAPDSEIVAGTGVAAVADGGAPRAVSIEIHDDAGTPAGTGQIGIVTFDQTVTGTHLDSDWTIPTGLAVGAQVAPGATALGHTLGTDQAGVLFSPAIAGELTPDFEFAGALLVDTAASPATVKRMASVDKVAPVVSSYSSVDANGDGSIEAILVTMSEPIDDSFVAVGDFTMVGGTISTFNTKVPGDVGAGTDDATFLLNLGTPIAGTAYDAAVTIKMVTTTLVDLAGNVAVDDSAPVSVLDGAAPVILSAEGSVGVADVTVTFSEPVDTDGAGTALIPADFQWVSSNGGASGIVTVTATADLAIWTVEANAPLVSGDLSADKIHAIASSIFEKCGTAGSDCLAAEQNVPVTQKSLSTIGSTTITSVATDDADLDGSIDGIRVGFSDNVDDSTFVAGSWVIKDGATTLTTGALSTGTTADDDEVVIAFTAPIVGTDMLVDLTFTSGSFLDLTGKKVASFTGTATDGAGPVIIEASTSTGLMEVVTTFSEPVTVASGTIGGANMRYVDTNGGLGATSISSASHTAGSEVVTLTLNKAIIAGDFTGDMVAARATILDTAGNSADLTAKGFVDGVAPTIDEILTEDLNANGIVDQVRVSFSEDVAVGACTVGDWTFTTSVAIPMSGVAQGAANEWVFSITTPATSENTDLSMTVDYTGTCAVDGTANALAMFANLATTDGAPPVILTAETQDANGNGKIDGLLLDFSEDVDDSTFSLGNWDVAGYTVTNWSTGTVADDDAAVLKLAEKNVGDTSVTPDILIGTGIMDMAGLDSVEAVAVTDGAPPALMDVEATLNSDQVEVTFSEVVATAPAGGVLTLSDFEFINNAAGGATNIIAIVDANPVYTFTLDNDALAADLAADKIGVVANEVFGDVDDLAVVTPAVILDGTAEDTTAPGAIGGFTATDDNGVIDLAWTTPSDTDLSTFEIRYSTTALTAGNFATGTLFAGPTPVPATAQTASIPGLTAGTTYYVGIRVTDTAGLHSPIAFASATTTAPDTTNPGTINDLVASAPSGTTVLLTWSPVGDDGATGTVTSYEIRYSTTAITTVTQFNAATLATATFSPATLLAGSATTDQTATVTGLTASTTYFIAVRGVDEADNKGVFDSATFTTTTPDTTPPTGTLVITSATHTAGVSSDNNDPSFSWTGLTDDEAPISYFTKLTTDSAFVLTATNGDAATGTTASFTDVAGGTHYFHVIGVSEGGASAPATFEVVIVGGEVAKTAADAKALSEKTTVTVTRNGNSNTVEYSNGDAVSEGAAGGQISVFNSPGVIIHTFGIDDLASGKFVHTGDDAKADSRYLVTYFFAGDIGKFATDAGPEEADYTVVSPKAEESKFYEETWFIVVIIIVAVLLLALIVLLVVFATRKNKATAEPGFESDSFVDDGWTDDSWDEPVEAEGLESHDYHLKCPSCATDFHVSGVKPLETSCPGCGVAGTLD